MRFQPHYIMIVYQRRGQAPALLLYHDFQKKYIDNTQSA